MASEPAARQDRLARHPRLWQAALAAWLVLATVGAASLAVGHTAALSPGLTRAALQSAPEARHAAAAWAQAKTAWAAAAERRLLVHVVAADCSCTQRLLQHLLSRGRLAGTDEVLLHIGADGGGGDDDLRRAAHSAGLRYQPLSAQALATRFGLNAAPVLVAIAPSGQVDYLGGYFDHPAAIQALDLRLHAQWLAGQPLQGLPVFGCAVGQPLRRALDPLGLVYPRG